MSNNHILSLGLEYAFFTSFVNSLGAILYEATDIEPALETKSIAKSISLLGGNQGTSFEEKNNTNTLFHYLYTNDLLLGTIFFFSWAITI